MKEQEQDAPPSDQPQHKPNAPTQSVEREIQFEEMLRNLQGRFKPYANLVFAVVGGIALVVLAGYWFSSQAEARNDEAYRRLTEAKDVNELAAIEPQYAGTEAHPYLLFELACRRHDDAGHDPVKLKDALADFKRLADLYPNHYLTGLVRARAREAEEDIQWVEEQLPKKLSELDAARKAYEQESAPKDDGSKKPGEGTDEKKDGSGEQKAPEDGSKQEPGGGEKK